jgi:hypothetical protein
MHTKLTLRMDEKLIERAKAHSKATGKSVSQLVADYLAMLQDRPAGEVRLRPIVRSLRGLLRGARLGEEDYRRHLEDKYL